MAVLEGGNPSFWRDIAIGMQQYVVALQRQFMLDAFDAEEVLRLRSVVMPQRSLGWDTSEPGSQA